MQTFILRRLLIGIVILFILSVAVFLLLRIVPGDPAVLRCGLGCKPEQLERIRAEMGLDKSYPVQYFDWLRGVVTGDLGESAITQRPAIESLKTKLPVTFELLILTMIFTILVGIPFGVISAVFRNSFFDYIARTSANFGLAVPNFWVATLVLIIPVTYWGYAPPLADYVPFREDPWTNLRQFGPPAAVLALASAAGIMRLARSSLLEVMRQDYMRTARAKGLRERLVVFRHGLKNSLIPVVTVLGLQLTGLIGGAVIIENVFTLPGLGQFFFNSLIRKDYVVVQSLTLYIGALVILINLAVDISYAWFDPRIRYS